MRHTTSHHAERFGLGGLATAAAMSAFVLLSCGTTVALCRWVAEYLLTTARVF